MVDRRICAVADRQVEMPIWIGDSEINHGAIDPLPAVAGMDGEVHHVHRKSISTLDPNLSHDAEVCTHYL